jgi:chaperonin GroEL
MEKNMKGTLAINKQGGFFNSLVIEVRGQELEDMASMAGATLISDTTGIKLSDVKKEHLGLVKKITCTDKKTLILGMNTDKTKTAIEVLRQRARQTKNIYEAKHFNTRADNLEGGIAIIKVGAPTDTEKADLKLKITNAVNATKSALDEGIVEGGGMCLYKASNSLKTNSVGNQILRIALKAPLKNIVENAGEEYADVARRITRKKGYNATTNKTVDMFKEGIIDSAKATRCAFINALSSAYEFITVGTAITNLMQK